MLWELTDGDRLVRLWALWVLCVPERVGELWVLLVWELTELVGEALRSVSSLRSPGCVAVGELLELDDLKLTGAMFLTV